MSDDTADFSQVTGQNEFTDEYGHDVHLVTHEDGTTDQFTSDGHGGFDQMHIDPLHGTSQEGVTADGIQYHNELDTSGNLTSGEYADEYGNTSEVDLQGDGTYTSEADLANGEHVTVTNMSEPDPFFNN
jgi:hypothetical protein